MRVFKFGGASVNSAEAIKNVAHIVHKYLDEPMVVVISAMGKTTNLLEKTVPGVTQSDAERAAFIRQSYEYHLTIAHELLPPDDPTFSKIERLFDELDKKSSAVATNYNYDYDQVVSFGELISTTLISGYLNNIGLNNIWLDVRNVIRTNENYREGIVDFKTTEQLAKQLIATLLDNNDTRIIVTQGFVAGTAAGTTTTLGREGSDYSASILSYCLDARSMTIWKDVPGFLNADPKFFSNTVKINKIPFNEAIELAYYGASVIHPKTVKPIQNKGIHLNIRSFINPDAEGSIIGPYDSIEPLTPLYIFTNNQLLISVQPKDFSFIAEENLQTIFAVLARLNVRVNIMQNSALSFSLCMNHNEILLKEIREQLESQYRLVYNTGLQLITIRYYNQQIIDEIVAGRNIILQQRSRSTAQLLVDAL